MTTRDRNLSEGKVDAEIEKTQQKITLALQQIDENFATCNQIVTSKIGPGIEHYGEASHQIWESSKTWLYFFSSMNNGASAYSVTDEESDYSTNRPAFDESSVGSGQTFKLHHQVTANDITNLTNIRGTIRDTLLKQKATTGSTMDTTVEENRTKQHQQQHHYANRTPVGGRSIISMSSGSSASNNRPALSPPHSIPFPIDAASLRGTPVREQAKILTDHTLLQMGIRSSESESSEQQQRPKRPRTQSNVVIDKESLGKAWNESIMDKDDPESRARFNEFLQKRQVRLQEMPGGFEIEPIPATVMSPSNRTSSSNRPYIEEQQSIGTPTMERISSINQPAMTPSSNRTNEDLIPRRNALSDFDVEMEDNISALAPSPGNSSFHAPSFTPLRDQPHQIEDNGMSAFEFADTLPQKHRSSNSHYDHTNKSSFMGTPSSTRTGGSDITMKQGQHTSLIPAQFGLQYFPEKFRSPPASVKLTRVYHEFNNRPGTMLTISDILRHINDPSYKEDYVAVLISLLTRKKYLKKVGNRDDAWVIRR